MNNFDRITPDLDFGMILAASRAAKPSVVQVRIDDIAPATEGAVISATLLRYRAELIQGPLPSIEPHRQRVRVLPLV